MEKHLNKLINANKEVFNVGVSTFKSALLGKDIPTSIEPLLKSIITSGAIGTWLEYEELATKNRVILGTTTVYSLIIKEMLTDNHEVASSILYMIKRNINAGLLSESNELKEINSPSIEDLITDPELLSCSLQSKSYYESFINLYQTAGLKRFEKDKSGVVALKNEMPIEYQVFIKAHNTINEHYFKKIQSYNEEDIAIICNSLKSLEIVEEVIEKVKRSLTANLVKRKNKEIKRQQQEQLTKPHIQEEQPKKESLSKREYNTIYKELETYYDPETSILKRQLTFSEVIYCIKLMLKLNIQEPTIDKFIKVVDKANKDIENPISLYIYLYNKIIHYKDIPTIQEKIALIEEYLSNIFICTDEEYEICKELIGEELSTITSLLPKDGTYEKETAKKTK